MVILSKMKLYESAYTYFPFVYLFAVASLFGGLYHNSHLYVYQPYVILVFLLLNTVVFYFHESKTLIKTVIHAHVWKTVTFTIYGMLINNIHTEMLRDFHFANFPVNVSMSILYITLIFICRYLIDSDRDIIYVHIVFLFFPLQRVWQVNLYMFVVFTTMSIIIMFQRVYMKELTDKKKMIHMKPVIDYFMYIRIYDMLIFVGFIQLYMDYYKSILPEIRAVSEIEEIIEEEREFMKSSEV